MASNTDDFQIFFGLRSLGRSNSCDHSPKLKETLEKEDYNERSGSSGR
jgi:hypothetical protein